MYVCEDYVSTEFWALIVKAPFNILKFLTDDVNHHNFGLT